MKVKSLLINILLVIILILVSSVENVNLLSSQSDELTLIEMTMYDDKNYPVYMFREKYNNKNQLVSKKEYYFRGDKAELYSNTEYVYDDDTKLIKYEYSKTPNYLFIYKSTVYHSKKQNGIKVNTYKECENYLYNRTEKTYYTYNNNAQVTEEKLNYEINNTNALISEKLYSYKNGKLDQIEVYFLNEEDSHIFDTKKRRYFYDAKGNLSVIETYDSEDKIDSKIEFSYNLAGKVTKELIYESELVLSNDNMSFERLYVKKYTKIYKYK